MSSKPLCYKTLQVLLNQFVKYQKAFDETIFAELEKAHLKHLKNRLEKQAKSLGFQLVTA